MYQLDEPSLPTNDELLARADQVRHAALLGDGARLERTAGLLLDEYVDHMASQRHHLDALPHELAMALRRGQERVLEHLLTLTVEADGEVAGAPLDLLATRTMTLLAAQVEAEERALRDR